MLKIAFANRFLIEADVQDRSLDSALHPI